MIVKGVKDERVSFFILYYQKWHAGPGFHGSHVGFGTEDFGLMYPYMARRQSIMDGQIAAHLQHTLGDDPLWDFGKLLAQVVENLGVNLLASLGHSCTAGSGPIAPYSCLGPQWWHCPVHSSRIF